MIPLAYGEGVSQRIREGSGRRLNAFIDTFGANCVERALILGVQPERINTIFNFAAVEKYGVKSAGNAQDASAAVLAELARRIDQGISKSPLPMSTPSPKCASPITRWRSAIPWQDRTRPLNPREAGGAGQRAV